MRTLVAMLSMLVASVASADGSWTICNRTGDKMTAAIAYVNPGSQGGFISEGWWTVNACGGCKTVLQRHETSDPRNVFIYVEDQKGSPVLTGESRMCRAKFRHTIVGNDRCEQRGFQNGYYKRITIDLNKTWTTNVTPGAGRARCID